jgi:putative peptidoglycan lipid II flippase
MELLAVRMVGVASITICFIGLAGYARAALNAYQIFGIPASVYAAYNIGILGSILLLHERLGIYSAALGLALGSALMFLVQVPTFLRTVGLPRLSFKIDRTILNEFVAFVPLGVFVIARHGQVYVERFLGSFLEPGVISQLNFATRLAQFPMSVAITVGIVSFPVLARAMAAGRTEEAEKSVESDIKMVSTLILPATAYLIIFAPEVVAVLFERGAFTPDDTVATASILRIYSLGLLAQTLIMVGIRPFYTHRYSIWMPMRAALGGLAVTVAVDVALLRGLGADGLAAGNAAGISVMALILGWDMNRHVVNVNTRRLARFFLRIFGVVILASFCALPLVLPQILPGLPKLGTLLFGAVILGIVYLIVGRSLDIEEIKKLQNYAMRVTGGRDRG